jgi:serine/threonine-protein kinase RsbW
MVVASTIQDTAMDFRFRSDIGRISIAADRIMHLVEESRCVLGQEIEVELALREALNNAVMHGNHMDPDKWVYVRCRCAPDDGVSIVVQDEGEGFDPDMLPHAPFREGTSSGCGTGLLIMRSYMDEVSFEKRGTEVHLRKAPAIARPSSSQPTWPEGQGILSPW